ncbi:MAG: M20/M25/M40 family metallo-hydrolase, partial [Candidatus Hodarchaeota archaeon]
HRGNRLRGKHPLFETLKSGGMKGLGRCTNMTVGILRAGDWPAIVAGTAELVARIGFPPSERGVDVIKEVSKTIENVARGDNWMKTHPPKIEWFGSRKEGYELNPKTPIVKTLKKNVEKISKRSDLFALSSAADSNHLNVRIDSYGGIPSVWYGPGGGQAHAVDEYVELEQIINVCKTLSLTILDWCQVKE